MMESHGCDGSAFHPAQPLLSFPMHTPPDPFNHSSVFETLRKNGYDISQSKDECQGGSMMGLQTTAQDSRSVQRRRE